MSLLVFAPHIRKESEDGAQYQEKFSTFLARHLVNQDKCVILHKNYRQIRNIREDGNKNTENNGVQSKYGLHVWRLAHTAGTGCQGATCLHEERMA